MRRVAKRFNRLCGLRNVLTTLFFCGASFCFRLVLILHSSFAFQFLLEHANEKEHGESIEEWHVSSAAAQKSVQERG